MAVVLAPTDLGTDFIAVAPGPVLVNIDNVCLVRDGANKLTAVKSQLSQDIPSNSLILTHADGSQNIIDLTAILNQTEIFVDGGTYNPASMELTLTDNSGATPDVVIPLAGLLGVSSDLNQILTNGSDGKPFLDCAKIKADCTTACTDLAGNPIFFAFAP